MDFDAMPMTSIKRHLLLLPAKLDRAGHYISKGAITGAGCFEGRSTWQIVAWFNLSYRSYPADPRTNARGGSYAVLLPLF
jgi:hypothetical protein